MTDLEVIRALRSLSVETGSLACLGCGHEQNCSIHGCEITRVAADRLEQLTAEPPNDPLTLEELRGMDGEPVYIQYIGTFEGFYDDETAPYYGQLEQYIQKYNGMLRACDLPLKYYGKTWLAYRRKPDRGGEQ